MPRGKKSPLAHIKKRATSETARNRSSKKKLVLHSSGTVESSAHLPKATVIIDAYPVVVEVQIALQRGKMRTWPRSIKTARRLESVRHFKGNGKRGKLGSSRAGALRTLRKIVETVGPTALTAIEVMLRLLGLSK
jgi:hypothetical protein